MFTNYNPNDTYLVLIGNGEYEDSSFTPIPNVKSNLEKLKLLFLDESIFGVPQDHILTLHNCDKKLINRNLTHLVQELNSRSLLIFYYTGHGVLSQKDFELYFPTIDSHKKFLEEEGLNAKKIRNKIEQSRASKKILIFDCCYSGKALGTMSSVASSISTKVGLPTSQGTYIMASSSQDKPSLYPIDKPESPTYFTSKLIETLNLGLENSEKYCEIGKVFEKIKYELVDEENLPEPVSASRGDAHKILFGRNRRENTLSTLLLENKYLKERIKILESKNSFTSSTSLKETDLLKMRIKELEINNDVIKDNLLEENRNLKEKVKNLETKNKSTKFDDKSDNGFKFKAFNYLFEFNLSVINLNPPPQGSD